MSVTYKYNSTGCTLDVNTADSGKGIDVVTVNGKTVWRKDWVEAKPEERARAITSAMQLDPGLVDRLKKANAYGTVAVPIKMDDTQMAKLITALGDIKGFQDKLMEHQNALAADYARTKRFISDFVAEYKASQDFGEVGAKSWGERVKALEDLTELLKQANNNRFNYIQDLYNKTRLLEDQICPNILPRIESLEEAIAPEVNARIKALEARLAALEVKPAIVPYVGTYPPITYGDSINVTTTPAPVESSKTCGGCNNCSR